MKSREKCIWISGRDPVYSVILPLEAINIFDGRLRFPDTPQTEECDAMIVLFWSFVAQFALELIKQFIATGEMWVPLMRNYEMF